LSDLVTPSESRENQAASRAADARFAAMLRADEAHRAPQTQQREWDRWERRNPGTVHPGRAAQRISRGLQERADDWTQGTARFQKPVSTIAERARRSRSEQRRPAKQAPISGPTSWDDDDPELEAEMIDGNAFRAGYRHAGYVR
jgi:hypothetical protein